MDYISTDLGADSSSHFSVREWRDRQTHKLTDGTECPTHPTVPAGVGNKN